MVKKNSPLVHGNFIDTIDYAKLIKNDSSSFCEKASISNSGKAKTKVKLNIRKKKRC